MLVLCLRHSGGKCLLTTVTTNTYKELFFNGSAMKLRLMEQACGCSKVLRVALWWRVLAAATMHTCIASGLQRTHYEGPTDGASLQLLHGARRRRTQGACSFSACCTRVESACHRDLFNTASSINRSFMVVRLQITLQVLEWWWRQAISTRVSQARMSKHL